MVLRFIHNRDDRRLGGMSPGRSIIPIIEQSDLKKHRPQVLNNAVLQKVQLRPIRGSDHVPDRMILFMLKCDMNNSFDDSVYEWVSLRRTLQFVIYCKLVKTI